MRSLPRAAFALLLPLLSGCPGSEKDRPPDSETTDSSDTSGADSTESAETAESVEETDTSGESDSETGESGESDTGEESGGDTETGTVDSGPVEGPWSEVSLHLFACVVNGAGGLVCFDDPTPDMGGVPPPWGPYQAFDVGQEPITCVVSWAGATSCYVDPDAHNWCNLELTPTEVMTTVSVGATGACGLSSDGVPVCWGCDPIVSDAPREGGFLSVDVGYNHACGIDSAEHIRCWGTDNGYDELSPPGGSFASVSTGSAAACAVSTGGEVTCWGNVQDDLVDETPSELATKVSFSRDWACAILLDGELTCWGVGVDKYPTDWESVVLPTGPFVDLSVGHILACGVREDGTLACFRDNGEPFTDGVP